MFNVWVKPLWSGEQKYGSLLVPDFRQGRHCGPDMLAIARAGLRVFDAGDLIFGALHSIIKYKVGTLGDNVRSGRCRSVWRLPWPLSEVFFGRLPDFRIKQRDAPTWPSSLGTEFG